jgi:hypothetical protein
MFHLLRGTHTPSFAHSAPMRAMDLFGLYVDAGAPLEGALEGLSFFSYISLRDTGCKTRIIHSFIHSGCVS